MSGWREYSLSEIAEINPTEKLAKNTVAPKISMENLQPFTKKPNGQSLEKYNGGTKFRNGDTLLARITPCLENGKTAYVNILKDDEIGFGSTEYIVLREKTGLSDKQFLYYFARSDEFREIAIASMTGSSGRQRVQTEVVTQHKFLLPPLPEQKAIADVLSALDDKIDLLHRQNHTLEQMAETLFRQWFVEEAQEDWEEVMLGQFITCVNGVSYKSSELTYSKNALVTLKNFARNGGLRKDGFKEYSGQFKDTQIVKDGDIVVAHTDLTQDASLIGNPIYVYNLNNYDNLVISMDLVKVILKPNALNQTFLYYLLKSSDFKEFALTNSNGSSVIHLSKKALPNFIFKLPPENKIKYFYEFANPLDKKLALNLKQIQTLETLRDTLLPKLISGEVRVAFQTA